MKKIITSLTGVLMGVGLACSTQAINVDITIPDGVAGDVYAGIPDAASEDDEVEPRARVEAGWDLEAFYFDADNLKLSMQGEYNFESGLRDLTGGDIFIDLNGDAAYGRDLDGTGGGNVSYTGNWGYEYVVAFNYDADGKTDFTYTIYDIRNSATTTLTVFYNAMAFSNPWRYEGGGVAVPTATGLQALYGVDNTSTYGLFPGGSTAHNVVSEINLSSIIDAGDGFLVHYTMECGNDLLIGQHGTFSVADGGTIIFLLGISLSGLAILQRKLL